MLKSAKLRGVQFGFEVTQGTAVAANRLITNGSFTEKRQNNVKKVTASGHKSAIGAQRGKRWTEWTIDGDLDYNLMPYWATMLLNITYGTGTTLTAGAYQYGGIMDPTLIDTPQTVTFEYGNNQGSNSRFAFGTMTDLTITVSDKACTYQVKGLGAYPNKNITLTATPTRIAPAVANELDYQINYATSFGGLGSGKLLTAREIEMSVKNKYASVFFVDNATSSIGGILEKQADITGSITCAEGGETDFFLGDLENSTLSYLQLQGIGALLVAGSPNYFSNMTATMAVFFDAEDEEDDQDLFAGKYTFNSAEDAINGDFSLTAICALATL